MTKKRITALILVFAMVFTMTACRNTENLYGDTESKDALRICIDISGYYDDSSKLSDVNDFMISLKQTGGLENVVFEVIPSTGVERSTAITRIRTEIMAGGGPDVFIVNAGPETDFHTTVFPFPEKVMEAGLFLPLDEYMENNTEFTEWDKQQPVVLAAGRTEEGQQIIPLSYTFPVQTCPKDEYAMDVPAEPLSWQDTLTDPEYSAAYAEFIDMATMYESYNVTLGKRESYIAHEQYMGHVLGRLADYKEEELLFTEEELLQRINEILELRENNSYEEDPVLENEWMGIEAVKGVLPFTMLPMYSDDGGIAVTIDNFAAVNRNTDHPEEAYRVIDVLLRSYTQLNKNLYVKGLCGFYSIPLYDGAFHKDEPFNMRSFSDESYETFAQIKGQITVANFYTSLTYDLNMLLGQCGDEEDPVIRKALVHAAYDSMQRKVRE